MAELRSALEERVVATAQDSREGLVELLGDLVACDTTARAGNEPARDEKKLQRILARRLEALGAETDLWEPASTGTGDRHMPDDLGFAGRPQLAARLRGAGGGRSLLLNGHIDAVSAEPREQWASDPFRLAERDGRLYGRGIADMKGGLATMLAALEALRRADVRLAGDVVYCSVTDEESSGAGGFAAVAHGVRADAGICAEPTDFDVWVACRGSLTPVITIPGRPGHAEMRQPHWRAGGAVNAIDKLRLVLDAVARLNAEWRDRPDHQHPYVSPGTIVPTVVKGGEWEVTYPASCTLTCEAMYLPNHLDADGTGRTVEAEIKDWIERAVAADPWFEEHPLQWFWDCDVAPAEVPADHPIVVESRAAGAAVGRAGRVTGFDSWHDGATFTRHGGTPTVCFGAGVTGTAHTIDEWVTADDLVDHAAATALLAMRWCGVAD
jgi:acetylornithine deacetylase